MSKKLNIDSITSELEGSAFFPQKKIVAESPVPAENTTKTSAERTISSIKDKKNAPYPRTPSTSRTPVPPRRKIKQRHPFDIYEDQLEELRKLSLEDRMKGGIGSMSSMVREAIDIIIEKRHQEK